MLPEKVSSLRKHLSRMARPPLPNIDDPAHFLWVAQEFNRRKDFTAVIGQLNNRVILDARGDLREQICFARALAYRESGDPENASSAALEGLRFAKDPTLAKSLRAYIWNGESPLSEPPSHKPNKRKSPRLLQKAKTKSLRSNS